MTVLELVTALRDRLDDHGGDRSDNLWLTDSVDCAWTNERLTAFLDEAQKEYARRQPLRDSTTSSVVNVSLKAGTQRYKLHPSVVAVERVVLNSTGKLVVKIHSDDTFDSGFDPEGVEYYEEDLDTQALRVWKTPTVADKLELVVRRLPLFPLLWSENDAEPEIPERDHHLLLDWATYLAYSTHDSVEDNHAKAEEYRRRFEGAVRPRQSAHLNERRREVANARIHVRSYY